MKKPTANYPNIVDDKNQIHSVYPCNEYLTFGPWIYLVPQYKPKSVLMLGYGGGTTAGLIRMFYGDVPITAVDMCDCSEFNFYNVNLIQEDAEKFIKNCEDKYDTVIIDLYREGSNYLEPFVFEDWFVDKLKDIANYVILHAVKGDDTSAYKDLSKVRSLGTNSGSPFEPEIHYFMVNDVPIPVR